MVSLSWAEGGQIGMDDLDRVLLNTVQTAFPVEARPYLALAQIAGTTEPVAWQRIQALRQQGIIRRLGGVFDSHRLGYKSTLCAAKVPEEKIQPLAELLLEIPGVTHNYLRNHEYNMWFTLIAPSQAEVEKTLDRVKAVLDSNEVYSLPALRLFKISVDFDFASGKSEDSAEAEVSGTRQDSDEQSSEEQASAEQISAERLSVDQFSVESGSVEKTPGAWSDGKKPEPYPVDEQDKALIRFLQGDLSQSQIPFADLAEQLNWEEEEVLERTRKLQEVGIIRRFGAVLRHQRAGFTANAMGVWQVPEEKTEEIGKVMATFREVSHCYQRPTFPDWPYNLFTMIHSRSVEGCEEVMKRISQATGITAYRMLFSQTELKKSSMQYFLEEDD